MINAKQILNAEGLAEVDKPALAACFEVYNRNTARNRLKWQYYSDTHKAETLGRTTPPDFQNVDVSLGWCAKAVDMLAARSLIDTVGTKDGEDAEVRELVEANEIKEEYDRAKTSMLINGCGFWTVDKGGDNEPPAVVLFHDALSGAAVWDYRRRRVKCGVVFYDFETDAKGITPNLVHAYFDAYTIVLERINGRRWIAQYIPNTMGRPMFEAMAYRPSNARPFGKSAISRAAMAITDEAQRELVRTALHSELFSAPQRYMLGVSEDAFAKSKIALYMDSWLLASRDENNELPELGQFETADISSHLTYIEQLASRMAAECKLPPSALGVASHTFTSSDAMTASENELCIEAEAMNRTNGKALRTALQMALCVAQGKPFAAMTDSEKSLAVDFVTPSRPSISAQADAMVKIASVSPSFAGTNTFFKQLGFSEQTRRALEAEMQTNSQDAITAALFGAVK